MIFNSFFSFNLRFGLPCLDDLTAVLDLLLLKNAFQKERFLELISFLRNERKNIFHYYLNEYERELIPYYLSKLRCISKHLF